MKQMTIFAVILGVLVLISAVQAVQLNDIKMKISKGDVGLSQGTNTKSQTSTTITSSQGSTTKKPSSLPSNVKDLPPMVGGC